MKIKHFIHILYPILAFLIIVFVLCSIYYMYSFKLSFLHQNYKEYAEEYYKGAGNLMNLNFKKGLWIAILDLYPVFILGFVFSIFMLFIFSLKSLLKILKIINIVQFIFLILFLSIIAYQYNNEIPYNLTRKFHYGLIYFGPLLSIDLGYLFAYLIKVKLHKFIRN